MIKHVARMLNLPLEQAGAMLGVYSWDAQALIDAFMSAPEAVAARCGVSLSNAGALSLKRFADGLERSSALASPTGSRAPVHRLMQLLGLRSAPPPAPAAAPHEDDAQDMCGACLEEVPRWRLVSLGCGHDMCDGCWRRHLAASLEEHGKRVHVRVSTARRQTQALGRLLLLLLPCPQTRCPEPGCAVAVTQASWEALAEKSALQKYRQFVLRSFVPLTGNVAWCPNPKCTRALRYRAAEMTDITCQCGMRFCVSCDAQAHSPATCEEFTQWQRDREGLEDLLSQRLLMQEYKKVRGDCRLLMLAALCDLQLTLNVLCVFRCHSAQSVACTCRGAILTAFTR